VIAGLSQGLRILTDVEQPRQRAPPEDEAKAVILAAPVPATTTTTASLQREMLEPIYV
jgi:hypothetical protein